MTTRRLRYVLTLALIYSQLYINFGCPWASRANLVRSLKGLEDVIQLVVMDYIMGPEGWKYNPDRPGTDPKDPLYG